MIGAMPEARMSRCGDATAAKSEAAAAKAARLAKKRVKTTPNGKPPSLIRGVEGRWRPNNKRARCLPRRSRWPSSIASRSPPYRRV